MKNIEIKKRDDYSIEFKIRYLLKREQRRRNRYNVTLLLFLPQSFNINANTFDRGKFYNDLKLYIRFNTPSFKTKELLSRGSITSPLTRLENMVAQYGKKRVSKLEENFIYEIKLLGCIFKSLLRDSLIRIKRKLATKDNVEYLSRAVYSRIVKLHRIVERYHAFQKRVDESIDRENLRMHSHLMDEHLSLLFERYLTSFLRGYSFDGGDPIYDRLLHLVQKEIRYRKEAGLPSVLEDGMDGRKQEEYVYREKMLKRYSSEVLLFNVNRKDIRKRTEHLLYAFAAGISMIFATAIVFWGQPRFGGFTLPLFAVLVVSYMMKDRIKEIFRDLFSRIMGGHFFDRTVKLYDSRFNRKLAEVKERSFFLRENKLSPKIRRIRNKGSFEKVITTQYSEEIFIYNKRITLDAGVLRKIHNRIIGLADISIIDLKDLLKYLTQQESVVPIIIQKNRISLKPVQRIYHLNMIIHHQEDKKEHLEKIRLIVDAKGIKRIETEKVAPAEVAAS
jgi:hypothetical protein